MPTKRTFGDRVTRRVARRFHSDDMPPDLFTQLVTSGEIEPCVAGEWFFVRKTHRASGWRLNPAKRNARVYTAPEFLEMLEAHDPPLKLTYYPGLGDPTYVSVSFKFREDRERWRLQRQRAGSTAAFGMTSDTDES